MGLTLKGLITVFRFWNCLLLMWIDGQGCYLPCLRSGINSDNG